VNYSGRMHTLDVFRKSKWGFKATLVLAFWTRAGRLADNLLPA